MRRLLDHYVARVWQARDPDAVDDLLTPGFRRHTGFGSEPLSREGQKELLQSFQSAFPDAELTIKDGVVDGDRMAFRSTLRGTHRGAFRGVAPTGRRVTVRLLDLVRVEDGRFAEQWGGPDLLDLLLQLGARVETDGA